MEKDQTRSFGAWCLRGLSGPLPKRCRRHLDRSKSSSESTKIGSKTTKKNENSIVERSLNPHTSRFENICELIWPRRSGALGVSPRTLGDAFRSAPGRARDGQERSRDAPCSPTSLQDCLGQRPGSLREPFGRRRDATQERSDPRTPKRACANGHRDEFSFFFCTSVRRPNLSFRQPVQCSVNFG